MDIIYTSAERKDRDIIRAAKLECAFGNSENDFELTLDLEQDIRLEPGALVYVEGSEVGGIVDSYEVRSDESCVAFSGRSVHGLLASKIIAPDAGADYYRVTGELNSVLSQMVVRLGLDEIIKVETRSTGVSVNQFQFARYVDGWQGIQALLKAAGMRARFAWSQGVCTMGAVLIEVHPALETDIVSHNITHSWRPVNHLICLGKGELKDRFVVHYYANSKGEVSETQTLFGLDEVSATYDYSGAEEAELRQKGKEKLKELQDASSVDIQLESDTDYALGDVVVSVDSTTGYEVSAEITRKIVTIRGDKTSVEFKVGGSASSTSLSGSSESAGSGGGTVYRAGAGITISQGVISAEVTDDDIASMQTDIQSARKEATDASSAAGKAQVRGDEAYALADGKLAEVTATSPLSATVEGTTASVSHEVSGVVAGTYGSTTAYQLPGFGSYAYVPQALVVDEYGHVTSAKTTYIRMPAATATTSASGLMSSADKTKLDGIATGANKYILPAATTSALGGVKPDGTTITVTEEGVISAQPGGSASFLAAWPVGSIYTSAQRVSPEVVYGGSWRELPSMGGFKWERTA